MTNKNLTFAFRFAAIANNSLFSNFSRIGAEIGRMEEESKKYTKTLESVKNAFDRNTISAKSYSNAVLKLQSSMGKLKFNKYSMNMAKYGANAMQFKEMGNMIAAPVKEAMDFQSAMNKVEALMNETPDVADKNRATLEKLALQLGKELPYSAKEAADSMSFLAMAGWKTNNIVAGLPSLMKLAMAGGTDLARTADILSDDLTAFGLEADQSARMANVFATVITNTNTDVEKLGETMKYAAPVANAFGVSLEETAAMAGIMAGAGTKASQAGTSLRSGFLRLAGPPKKAREAMQELGMSMNVLMEANPLYRDEVVFSSGITLKVPDYEAKAQSVLPPWRR